MNCRHEWKPVQLDPGQRIPGVWTCEHCGADPTTEETARLEALCA